MSTEAVMWAKRGPVIQRRARVWDASQNQWINPVDELGRPVMERVPATGKVGLVRVAADIETLKPQRERRFISYLHADGNVCNDPIRSAAASQPGTDTSMEVYLRQKARALGWIEVGTCPVDEVIRRVVTLQAIASPDVRTAAEKRDPCRVGDFGPNKPPCKHFLAEEAARKERRRKETDNRETKMKSGAEVQAEKQTEAMLNLADSLRAGAADKAAPKGAGK